MSDDFLTEEELCEQHNLQLQLSDAIELHNCAVVNDIIHNKGISPNYKLEGRSSPICRAAHLGFVDILDILVEGGCDLLVCESENDIWHRKALHIAASEGHIEFVKQLLDYGGDINSRDNDQRTPLHWSATYGNAEMAEFLISKGASVNIAQSDGFTSLHAATCLGHSQVCRVLLSHGAEINRTDRDGWSAFHTAVCYGHIDVVETLLNAGASLTKLTNDEENVIHIAASSGKIGVTQLLLERGAKIDELNLNGNTAFYLAVYYNEFEMAKYLVKVGANMYLPKSPRKTPFYLAATRGLLDFLLLFVEAGYNLSTEEWLLQKDFPTALQTLPDLCNLLFRLASNSRTLKELCRFRARQYINFNNFESNIQQLELPMYLRNYISYSSTRNILR